MAYDVEPYRLVLPDWIRVTHPWVEIHATLPFAGQPGSRFRRCCGRSSPSDLVWSRIPSRDPSTSAS
jgi:hypothetical protein